MKMDAIQKKILEGFWEKTFDYAANALSLTLQKKIQIKKLKMFSLQLNSIPKKMNPKDVKTVVVWNVIKDPRSVVAISSKSDNVLKFADMLLHKEIGFYKGLSDENVGVICEVENIISGYFVDTFTKILNDKIITEEPQFSVNPSKSIEFFDLGNPYL
jgi:chemotaxis protein CheY-P-specific phosphatase CheC